jgi:hypothetical protein
MVLTFWQGGPYDGYRPIYVVAESIQALSPAYHNTYHPNGTEIFMVGGPNFTVKNEPKEVLEKLVGVLPVWKDYKIEDAIKGWED